MKIEVIGIGVFRQIFKAGKIPFEILPSQPGPFGVDVVLRELDIRYQGQLTKELYLEDGSPNLWTRVMLNGRDIRFLETDKLFVKEGDSVLIASVMAGG